MHRFVIAGLVAMATALSLPACPPKGVPQKAGSQGVPRKTAIGTFTDSNGQPLAGASVHFAFVPVGGEHLAPADAVEAVTDDRGRFRVALLSCTKYRAWGIGKLSESGSRPVSEVVWTTAADLLELRAARDFEPRTLELRGIDKWANDGPFRVRWLIGGVQAPHQPIVVNDDWTTKVPLVPAARCWGEVLNARNEVFTTFTFDPRNSRARVIIKPPQEIPVRATDEAGKAVDNVEIWQRLASGSTDADPLSPSSGPRHVWRRLGSTDGDGRFVARIASSTDPMTNTQWHQLTFLGKKAGYASSFSGFRREPFTNGKQFDRKGMKELPFLMQLVKPLRGRVLSVGGAAGNRPLRVVSEARIIGKDGNGWIHDKLLWSVETDAEGRFEIADMPQPTERCFLLPQPHPTALQMLPENMRRSAPPQPLALHGNKLARDQENVFDLNKTHVVRLQLLDRNSGPARGARVVFVSQSEKGSGFEWWSPQAVPDRAGRVVMRLEAGKWFVFVRNTTMMASAELDVGEDRELTMKLEPMPAMRGTVVDGKGNPIANAKLSCHSATFHSGNDESPLQPIASQMNWRWINSCRTDAEGEFVCAFLDLPNMYYEARFKIGKKQSNEFKVIASEDPETITIQ